MRHTVEKIKEFWRKYATKPLFALALILALQSCDTEKPKQPNQEDIETEKVKPPTTWVVNEQETIDTKKVDTSFYEIVHKVLNAKWVSQTPEYINNQIVFNTDKHTYTVWSTAPKNGDWTFSVWRRPIGTKSKDVLETRSVDVNTGKVDFFVTPEKEALMDNQYITIDWATLAQGWLQSQEKLEEGRAKELQAHFDQAQEEVVKQIKKRF